VTRDLSSRRYAVVSSDTHAGADLLDYKPYLDREFRDDFDLWAATFTDGWGAIDTEQMDTDDENLRVGPASFMSPYNWDSDRRLAHLDGEGIAAEVIFPNTVPPFYPCGVITAPAPTTEAEYRRRWAGARAHNRWLVDFCNAVPGRRAGLAQVFLTDVDDAIAELRWAKDAGLAGVLLPSDHHRQLVNLFETRLDPFWAVCTELDLPVHRHSITVGDAETPETGPAAPAIGLYESSWFAQRCLSHLTLGGVLHRHPELKFVFTEVGCAWVTGALAALDAFYEGARTKGSVVYPFSHRAVEGQEMLPSEYFRRNCYLGASIMIAADVELRKAIGADRIMWGADYPHHEGTWPHTEMALRLNFSGVSEEDVRTMTSTSAAHLYGLDLDFLQTVADKIGPTVQEVAKPVPAEEIPENSMCLTFIDAADPRITGVLAGVR
jgi:predicted TIM-barrel fold metal-dependent hydrolase